MPLTAVSASARARMLLTNVKCAPIHALNVDVVNLFHDVKDLNLTNRFVHRWISPVAIAKI